MSKCIELFNEWVCGKQPTCKEIWQAAWNARGKVDADLARNTICATHIPTGVNIYGGRAAEAIERGQCA